MFQILLYFISIVGSLFGNELFIFEGDLPTDAKTLFVSLGSGCDQGVTLRNAGLRDAAFPFDWLVTGNHDRFIALLDNDFAFFTDAKYFQKLPTIIDHPNSLSQSYYDIQFYHEGSVPYSWSDQEKFKEQMEKIQSKYARRIERFRQLRSYPGKVFFLRNFTSDPAQAARHLEVATELRDALRRYFPYLNFTLVIVTYHDVIGPDIVGIDGVIENKMLRGRWCEAYEELYQYLINEYKDY